MKRDFIIITIIVTIIASILFIYLNPILFTNVSADFSESEVFYPEENHYDFGLFSINASNTTNFTVENIKAGHSKLVSGKGYAINVLNYDKMLDQD